MTQMNEYYTVFILTVEGQILHQWRLPYIRAENGSIHFKEAQQYFTTTVFVVRQTQHDSIRHQRAGHGNSSQHDKSIWISVGTCVIWLKYSQCRCVKFNFLWHKTIRFLFPQFDDRLPMMFHHKLKQKKERNMQTGAEVFSHLPPQYTKQKRQDRKIHVWSIMDSDVFHEFIIPATRICSFYLLSEVFRF